MVFDGVVEKEVLNESVKDGKTRFLWLADTQSASAGDICLMYGNSMKCDVLQVAHHGNNNGGSMPLYQSCNPSVVFWCANMDVFEQWSGSRHNQYLVETAVTIHRQDQGNFTISFGDV
jgi:hypothetical protein